MTSTTAESTTRQPSPTAAPRREATRRPVQLLEELGRGPLVLDAGMGTRLCARGLDLREDDPCLWNLDRPEEVLDIHRRDAAAGCRVFFTNTFGANRAWLARFGRGGDSGPINRASVDLARRAAGPSGFVVGDIGPSAADESGAAGEQAAILVDAGADALILETFRLEDAIGVLRQLRSSQETPVVPLFVSLWSWPRAIEEAARRLVDAGADVVGTNCQPAMTRVSSPVRRLARAVACPILVKPGVAPGDAARRSIPSTFAQAVPVLVEHNVRLIGGCCGTTEAHVAAIAAACALHPNLHTRERRGTAP